MSKTKKIISLLLSLIMALSVFTIVPFTAGAAEAAEALSKGGGKDSGIAGTGADRDPDSEAPAQGGYVDTGIAVTGAEEANAAEVGLAEGDFEYDIDYDDTAEITGYTGSGGDVVIPSEIGGHEVTDISYEAFRDCTGLTGVVIPDTVTNIGVSAFKGCVNLESIEVAEGNSVYDSRDNCNAVIGTSYNNLKIGCKSTVIPDTVTCIGNNAFEGCTGLTSIIIPDSVEEISSSAFYGCTGLKSIDIPDSVTSIGYSAFSGCKGLTSVDIPKSVTEIGYSVFSGCTGLKEVNIGDSVTIIWNYAFEGCIGLTNIEIPGSVTSIKRNAFYGCTGLKSIDIPDSVTSFAESAFEGCTSLISVDIPGSVTFIDSKLFKDCTGLKSVTIPKSVTEIGDDAFSGCTGLSEVHIADLAVWCGVEFSNYYSNPLYFAGNLYLNDELITDLVIPDSVESISGRAFKGGKCIKSLTIPDNVKSIGNSAFERCSGLTSLDIPDTVESISHDAFCDCTGLKDVTIGKSVTSIDDYTFEGCTGLTSIVIPESVTDIGYGAFKDCKNLKIIDIPDTVSFIDENAFMNTAWFKSQPDGVVYAGKAAYTIKGDCPAEVTIKDGTLYIAKYAFEDCASLKKINIPGSVISIGSWAFYKCTGLTKVEIPDSVEKISYCSFSDCTGLKEIVIPASVTSIEDYAFEDCISLKEVFIPKSVSDMDRYAFSGCSGIESIKVEDGNTVFDSRNNCNALIITETNELALGCKNTVIPDTVICIGDEAFYKCEGLTSITIPDSVTEIYYAAFAECSSLSSIEIPASVTSIMCNSFESCSALATIKVAPGNTVYDSRDNCNAVIETETNELLLGCKNTVIPDTVTSIGESAFEDCDSLKSITIPDNVSKIGYRAFSSCSGLESVEFPDDPEVYLELDDYAFSYCAALKEIVIPDSIYRIPVRAFLNCSGAERIHLGANVSSIGGDAFLGCTSVKEMTVDENNEWFDSRDNCNAIIIKSYDGILFACDNTVIPDSISGIGNGAFMNCMKIKEVNIPDNINYIYRNAFEGCESLEKVTIPASTTRIDEQRLFMNCKNLKSIVVAEDNPEYDSRDNCNALIRTETNELMAGCTDTVIPDTVTSIAEEAFCGTISNGKITVPASVIKIGDYALGYEYAGYYHEEIEGFTIYGYKDTAAQAYAKENEIKFVCLDGPSGVTVSGSITSYLDDSDVTVKLTGTDNNFTAEVKGKSDYSFAAVPAGKYTMTVSKANHVTAEYSITVAGADITQDVEIFPLGDVTGDGKTNVQDCTAILRYVRQIDALSDEQLKIGDVTGDGKVNVQDVTRILRHVRQIEALY